MRTYWLSFCDDERPKGTQFLGACVVDVTDDDMRDAQPAVDARRAQFGGIRFKQEWTIERDPSSDDGYWIAAAITKAHQLGCNPGGNVMAARIDNTPRFAEFGNLYPRGLLCSREEVERIDRTVLALTGAE